MNDGKATVLLYLLEIKSNFNLINITQVEVSENTKVHRNTVAKVFKELTDIGLLKKIRNGTYLLHPDVMVRGGGSRWKANQNWQKEGIK